MLAYEPTNTKRDGGFRQHRGAPARRARREGADTVRVLRSRRPSPRRARAHRQGGGAAAAEQRRAEMRTALDALAPLTGIPVRLSADFVSLDRRRTQVVVNGSVDVAALPFVRRDDRRQATVETVAVVLRRERERSRRRSTPSGPLDLSDADYEQLRRRGLPYPRAVALKPGRYQVRLAARDDATGLLGSAWQRVEIPDLTAGRLALERPLPDEGRRARRRGRCGGPLPSCTASRSSAASAGPRASTCSSMPTTRSATRRARSTSCRRRRSCGTGAVLATAAPEPMVAGEPRGAGPPPVPDPALAPRARRLRAARHRDRPHRERPASRAVAFTVE